MSGGHTTTSKRGVGEGTAPSSSLADAPSPTSDDDAEVTVEARALAKRLRTEKGQRVELAKIYLELQGGTLDRDGVSAASERRKIVQVQIAERHRRENDERDMLKREKEELKRLLAQQNSGSGTSFDESLTLPREDEGAQH